MLSQPSMRSVRSLDPCVIPLAHALCCFILPTQFPFSHSQVFITDIAANLKGFSLPIHTLTAFSKLAHACHIPNRINSSHCSSDP